MSTTWLDYVRSSSLSTKTYHTWEYNKKMIGLLVVPYSERLVMYQSFFYRVDQKFAHSHSQWETRGKNKIRDKNPGSARLIGSSLFDGWWLFP